MVIRDPYSGHFYKPFYVFDRFKLRDVYFSLYGNFVVHLDLQFQVTDLHIFGLFGKALACRWFLAHLRPWNGTEACTRSPKISNSGHDRALSIRIIMLMMTTPSNYSFEHLYFGHYPWSKSQEASKMVYYSIFNRYLFKLSFHIFWVLLAKNTKLALVSNLGLKMRWDSVFCGNPVQIWMVFMKNCFLTLEKWSGLKSEPSKTGSSSISYALANSLHPSSCLFAFFELLDFFGWPTTSPKSMLLL
jgi:hypothetical protein